MLLKMAFHKKFLLNLLLLKQMSIPQQIMIELSLDFVKK